MMWNDRMMWDFDEPKQPAPPEDHYKGYDLNYKLYMDPHSVNTELIGTIKHVKTNKAINIKLSVKQDVQSLMDTCLNFYRIAHGLIDLFEEIEPEDIAIALRASEAFKTTLTAVENVVEPYSWQDGEDEDSDALEDLCSLEENEFEQTEAPGKLKEDATFEEKSDTHPTFDSLNSWFDQTDPNRWLNK